MNKNELSYSEILSLASDMKEIASQIEEVSNALNDDFEKFGEYGTIWTGDAATLASEVFSELYSKNNEYLAIINKYADYLVNNMVE